jgi:hypothetical protein
VRGTIDGRTSITTVVNEAHLAVSQAVGENFIRLVKELIVVAGPAGGAKKIVPRSTTCTRKGIALHPQALAIEF